MIELPRGQALYPVLTNTDIIAGLAYEHMTVEPAIMHKLGEKSTSVIFPESDDIKEVCNTL